MAGRAQKSLFAPVEKRLLVRMANATPRWINSDLTLLGFISMFFVGLCYALARAKQSGRHVDAGHP